MVIVADTNISSIYIEKEMGNFPSLFLLNRYDRLFNSYL